MSARFEVVRAADEMWHARFVAGNGRTVWWTENYRRKVGAEKAISAIRLALAALSDDDAVTAPITYIDDRLAPVARPELPDLEPTA